MNWPFPSNLNRRSNLQKSKVFSDCQKSKVSQIVRSFKFFSPVWISLVRGAGLLKVVELHVFIQLLQWKVQNHPSMYKGRAKHDYCSLIMNGTAALKEAIFFSNNAVFNLNLPLREGVTDEFCNLPNHLFLVLLQFFIPDQSTISLFCGFLFQTNQKNMMLGWSLLFQPDSNISKNPPCRQRPGL